MFLFLKKIDKLVIKSFLGPFIITFFITMLVFVLQFLWKYIDDLIGKNLELRIIGEFILLLSTTTVPEALPLAVLLAAIMTFGNLGENYELVALKSSGISFQRFMLPLLLVSMIIASGAFLFSNYVLPAANLKFTTLFYSITKQKPALNIRPGVFYDGISGYIINVAEKDKDNKTLHDLLIYDHTKRDGSTALISAERGEMYGGEHTNTLTFKLYNGHQYHDVKSMPNMPETYEHNRSHFMEYEMVIDLSSLEFKKKDEAMFKSNQKMMSVKQLNWMIDSFKSDKKNFPKKIQEQLTIQMAIRRIPQKEWSCDSVRGPAIKLLDKWCIEPESELTILEKAKTQVETLYNYNDWAIKQSDYLDIKKRKYEIALFDKFALSFACILLYLIGAPFGAIIRKGGMGLPMVISIILFVFFYIFRTMGRKFAEEDVMLPFNGVWLAIYIFIPLAFLLGIKATNDSASLELDQIIPRIQRLWTTIKQKFDRTT